MIVHWTWGVYTLFSEKKKNNIWDDLGVTKTARFGAQTCGFRWI